MATLIAKELGVKRVVAKAHDILHGKVLSKIGADKVVYPERDMGVRVAHNANDIVLKEDILVVIGSTSDIRRIEKSAGD